MDPYRVLGLEPGASQAEVKRAYRRLAKALHPDAAGEHALPAFLAVQEAYERLTGTKVRTVRPAAGSAGRGDGAAADARADRAHEPWRADPARARAAREQARTRRGWPGGRPEGRQDPAGREEPSGRRSASSGSATSGSGTGARQRRTADGSSTGTPPRPGAERTRGRRRSTRTATLGSTSYDEARDPVDRRWSGASWYGPTTGEYWHINPREYADPRKHGPGYVRRAHGGEASADEAPANEAAGGSRADAAAFDAPEAETAQPEGATASLWSVPGSDNAGPRGPGSVRRRTRLVHDAGPADPIRRLLPVLAAWPPLGLAAAAAIGSATGCSSQSIACDATDRMLPWLAQALLLGVLLLAPRLARVLASGTIALLLAVVPGAAIITALGGAGSAEGPPVLGGWLAIAWALGVAWAVTRQLRGLRTGGLSP